MRRSYRNCWNIILPESWGKLKFAVFYQKCLEITKPADANNNTLDTDISQTVGVGEQMWRLQRSTWMSSWRWVSTKPSSVPKRLPWSDQDPLDYLTWDVPIFPRSSRQHTTLKQELIVRSSILTVGSASLSNPFTQNYLDDKSKVWHFLSSLTRDLECWSCVSPAQNIRDPKDFLQTKDELSWGE